jgi:hypothetical protein
MTTTELLQLIRRKYRLVNDPSNEELQEVAKQLLELSEVKRVTNSDLLTILNNTLSDTTMMMQESVDMTASINIAQQIIDKLTK